MYFCSKIPHCVYLPHLSLLHSVMVLQSSLVFFFSFLKFLLSWFCCCCLSLSFMILAVLQNTAQLFCRLSLSLGWSSIFKIRLRWCILGKNSRTVMVKVVPARFPHHKVNVFPFRIKNMYWGRLFENCLLTLDLGCAGKYCPGALGLRPSLRYFGSTAAHPWH